MPEGTGTNRHHKGRLCVSGTPSCHRLWPTLAIFLLNNSGNSSATGTCLAKDARRSPLFCRRLVNSSFWQEPDLSACTPKFQQGDTRKYQNTARNALQKSPNYPDPALVDSQKTKIEPIFYCGFQSEARVAINRPFLFGVLIE